MYTLALAFLAGAWLASSQQNLPPIAWAWALVVTVPVAWYLRALRLPAGFASGYLWAVIWGNLGVANILSS
ncbi:MAG: hypothetical protein OEW08_08540, partial [Gammaproteobacteria bacterium]|nr:hypothetical protein [Gammaproteobacteria bacterium]